MLSSANVCWHAALWAKRTKGHNSRHGMDASKMEKKRVEKKKEDRVQLKKFRFIFICLSIEHHVYMVQVP